MSKQFVYTVHAYRYGDRQSHSYAVGVYSKKNKALEAAEAEEEYRGLKYECEVLEWEVDKGLAENHNNQPKIIKALEMEALALEKSVNQEPRINPEVKQT
jgi:hypothetical protein